MADADEKPDPNPMKFFEARPSPTREEQMQRIMVSWRDEFARIPDPEQRAKAEAAVRAHAENMFASADRYSARSAKWKKILDGLGEKNPVRSLGERARDAVERRLSYRSSSLTNKDYEKTLAIVTDARKASAAFKQRQHSQRQMEKDNDRER